MTLNTDTIAARVETVRRRIRESETRFGREPGSVHLLAVSKKHPASAIRSARDADQRRFGESYVQEAVDKVLALEGLDLEWHFIGPIQSNKTRTIAEHFGWVHGVDRLKIARRLSEQRPDVLGPLQICLQVNVSGETTKSGASPEDVHALAEQVTALPKLRLRGLMTIPAPAPTLDEQRVPFRRLRELFEALNAAGHGLDTLSMGMSGDLEAAVAEGATLVRIGTAIFGERERTSSAKTQRR